MTFYTTTPAGIPWNVTYSYQADAVVIYTDDELYAANGPIAANTAFVIGTTGSTWRQVSAGAVSPPTPVTQAAHGFAVGDWVAVSGASYIKATAANAASAEVVGRIATVPTVNTFTLSQTGTRLTGLVGLTPGPYYLSSTVPGAINSTAPSTTGTVNKPVFVADSATSGYVLILRGAVTGSPLTNPLIVKNIVDFTVAEPLAPAFGDVYINTVAGVGSTTAAQTFAAGQVYRWLGGPAWELTVPSDGWIAYNQTSDRLFTFDGATWTTLTAAAAQVISPDTNTFVTATNTSINFVVNGIAVGNVTESAGLPKWTLSGILDPVAYAGTAQTIAQRDALVVTNPLLKAGYIVWVVDTDIKEYQVWDGATWKTIGDSGLLPWEPSVLLPDLALRTGVRAGSSVLMVSNAGPRTSRPTFDATEAATWDILAQGNIPTTYPANETLSLGFQFSDGKTIWQLNSARTTGATFDATEKLQWTAMTGSDTVWEFTTNGINAVAGHAYVIDGAHTVNLPVATDGQSVRFATPVEWSTRGVTWAAPGATTVGLGQTLPTGFDVAEFIYNATTDNWVINLGGASPVGETVQALNAAGTVTAWDSVVLIGQTPLVANITIALPTVVGNTGKTVRFVRVDNTAFTVTVAADGAEVLSLIDAGSELNAQNGSITVQAVSSTSARQVAMVKLASSTVATLLDASSAAVLVTLPAATGSGAIRTYAVKDKTNAITIAVPVGGFLNEVVNATYLASNHAVGTELEVVDYATGKWSLQVVGAATSTSLTRIQAGLSASPTLVLNGDVAFDVIAFNGGIAMTAGVFSLKAGKTYRLKANLRLGSIPGGGPQFAWVNATTNAELVTSAGRSDAAPSSQANNTDGNSTAEVLYTTTADMTVKLRYIAGGSGARVEQYSTAVIEELPNTETVLAGNVVPAPLHVVSIATTAPDVNSVATVLTESGVGGYYVPNLSDTSLTKFDPNVMIVGNKVVIKQAGLYHLSAGFKSTSGSPEPGIRVNGVYVATGDASGSIDYISYECVRALAVNDVVDFCINGLANSSAANGFRLIVKQIPTSTVVNPGDVPVTNLHYGRMFNFNSTDFNFTIGQPMAQGWSGVGPNNVGVIVNAAAGTLTATQAGTYKASVVLHDRSTNLTSDVIGFYVNGAFATQVQKGPQVTVVNAWNTHVINARLVLQANDVVTVRIVAGDTNICPGEFALEQVPTATVAGTVPVASQTAGGVMFGNGAGLTQDVPNLFYDDTNNRLGVGNNAPVSKIHVTGDGNASPNNAGVRLENNGTLGRTFMFSSRSDGGVTRAAISDETAAAERVSIGINGFVGIGATNPQARLHVKGDSNGDASQAAIRFQNDGPGGRVWNSGTRGDGGTQRFYISDETGAAERFGIDDSGKIWVGQGAGLQLIPGYGNAGLNVISIGGSDGMNVKGPGANNAVNIYNPTGGDTTLISFITDDGGTGEKGRIRYNSSDLLGGNVIQYLTTSDERLKTDTGREAKGLEDLMKIQVRNYDWKVGGNADGFFAQELHAIVPGAVSVGSDELDENGNLKNPWSVDYGKLTTILVKAVQDLNAKVEMLTQQLNAAGK